MWYGDDSLALTHITHTHRLHGQSMDSAIHGGWVHLHCHHICAAIPVGRRELGMATELVRVFGNCVWCGVDVACGVVGVVV